MKKSPVFVTQPSLPPLEELIPYLEQIWESKVLTNGGAFHQQLESALSEYLGVPYISLFSNGTVALMTALKALDIKGEVITTPYSFVATANSLLWNGLKPVFADIDPVTLNLDPAKIEAAITPRTTAIMPVHVYGHPCEVDAINAIATRRGLKVIYDAAHAFGVQCHCGSVLNHGDLSVLSFHATKVFNTFEGGAIVCKTPDAKRTIDQLKNFGFVNEVTVTEVGINGKLSEFNAALGLLQLQNIDTLIEQRRVIDSVYREELKDVVGIRCHTAFNIGRQNYSYFPIFVEDEYPLTRDDLFEKLQAKDFKVKKYFFPLITEFSYIKNLSSAENNYFPNAQRAALSVLCLPMFPSLSLNHVARIAKEIKKHSLGRGV